MSESVLILIASPTPRLRVLVALTGDLTNDAQTRVKYGDLVDALRRRYVVAGIYNAQLTGISWFLNTVLAWHPDKVTWRERATKSVFAFATRSRNVSRWARALDGQADVILQLGTLFDAGWGGIPLRQVIYTDYTARLSSQQSFQERSPFKGAVLERWVELERRAYIRAARVCVRSAYVRESIVNEYGVPAEHTSVVGGGVNFPVIPELSRSSPPNTPPVALFIGSDFLRKGGDLVLQAFASIRTSHPTAKLLLLTKGPIPSELPLDGVQVIQPTWDRQNLLDLYRQADLFVMPSRLETWGDVFLEAMAFGLPCIGVKGQAMAEIIRPGETGLLVEPNRVDLLANALNDLFSNPEKRRQMGQRAHTLVHQEYTWDRVVDRMVPALESVVDQ